MNARRITEIILETTEFVTVRRAANAHRIACTECDSVAGMVSLDQAFALLHFGARAICKEIEAGRLHFQETDSGSLLICLDSLQKVAQQSPGNSNPPINQIKEVSS